MQKMYDIDFSYKIEEYGNIQLPANDVDHAENEALAYVKETFEDAVDIKVDGVRELKD